MILSVSKKTETGEAVLVTETAMNAAQVERAGEALALKGIQLLAEYPVLVS